jgi:hypothetical protein
MADAMIRLALDDELVRLIGQNATAAIHHDPLISRHVEILNEIIGTAIGRPPRLAAARA